MRKSPRPSGGPKPPPRDEMAAAMAEMAAEVSAWQQAAGGSLVEVMAGWAAAQYLSAARQEAARIRDSAQRLRLFRDLAAAATALQRGAYWVARLALARERLAFDQEKFRHPTAPSAPRERPDYLRPLTDDERKAIVAKVDDILGIPPDLSCPPSSPP